MEFLKKSVLFSVLALLATVGCGRVEAKITKLTTLKNPTSQETICFVEDDGASAPLTDAAQQESWKTITQFCQQENTTTLCANAFLLYNGSNPKTLQNQNNCIQNAKKIFY